MTNIKKIGVLTSGGDCAGLNAVVMSVVNAASKFGWEVYGIHDGTDGLTNRPLSYEILTEENFSNTPWPRLAGSYLGSLNTGVKESQEVLAQRFGEGVRELGLDAVVVIGGDGSMNIVSAYCHMAGVKMIGIPKTIDNDTPLTEFSVGFNTACQICTNALDDLMTTARSHHRALILEVMGRDAGFLAQNSAIACGAEAAIIPEESTDVDQLARFMERGIRKSKKSCIVIVSESPKCGALYYADRVRHEFPEFDVRVSILGHLQRGGRPTAHDRILASCTGVGAIEAIMQGQRNIMVGIRNNEVVYVPLSEAIRSDKPFNKKLIRVLDELSI